MATQEQINSFIDTIGPIAAKVCKERGYGNAQAWTCVAQACCESAYGTSRLMKNANAFFGIKATTTWVKTAKYGGLVYSSKTKECYDGKTLVTINDTFRAYRTMEDSVRDYFDLIEMGRYKLSLKTDTVKDCITAIKNGGYATAPNYISTIMNFYTKSQDRINRYAVTDEINIVEPEPVKKSRKTIALGSSGDDVLYLHKRLREFKYGVDADNDKFDDLTYQCVIHFQTINGLVVDGIVGPKTWGKIDL